jgi:coproporphyrinogen III oxidase-like Fe-S oxidoreductase
MPDELIETLHLVRDLHGAIRISVETNPDDLDDDQVPLMVEAGVNRLSVGVQSFDDQLLREMLRYDKYGSGAKIRERLERVHGTFDTVNVDMIFNFPHQTEEILERDLEILCDELRADQVSYYPLMTAPTARKSMLRNLGSVDYRREKRLYRIIARHLQNGGFSRSSAWCFSRSDGMIDEYITGQDDYLGLGSGAFSYLDGNIYASTFSINHYLHLVEQGQTGIIRQRAINRSDQMRYFLMMRLFGGSLDLDEAEHKFGGGFRRGLRLELAGLRLMGAVRMHGSRIELTDSGYYLWVTIMREFFTGVNNLRDEMRHSISAEAGMLPGAGAESREPDSLR